SPTLFPYTTLFRSREERSGHRVSTYLPSSRRVQISPSASRSFSGVCSGFASVSGPWQRSMLSSEWVEPTAVGYLVLCVSVKRPSGCSSHRSPSLSRIFRMLCSSLLLPQAPNQRTGRRSGAWVRLRRRRAAQYRRTPPPPARAHPSRQTGRPGSVAAGRVDLLSGDLGALGQHVRHSLAGHGSTAGDHHGAVELTRLDIVSALNLVQGHCVVPLVKGGCQADTGQRTSQDEQHGEKRGITHARLVGVVVE